MWFELQSKNLAYTVNAPHRFDIVAVLDASPERVFDAFANPGDLARFIFAFRRCEWQSPAPHGVGATRQLDLWGLSFREHFLAWEPGRRFCFSIDAMTLPLMRAMVEDIQIEPVGDGKARLIWTVHYTPRLVTQLMHPFARMSLELGYQRSVDQLARFLLAHPAPGKGEGTGARLAAVPARGQAGRDVRERLERERLERAGRGGLATRTALELVSEESSGDDSNAGGRSVTRT